jgi:hypothetical protein
VPLAPGETRVGHDADSRHGDELTGAPTCGVLTTSHGQWARGVTVRVGGGAAADGDICSSRGLRRRRVAMPYRSTAAAPTGSLPPASGVQAVDDQGCDLAGAGRESHARVVAWSAAAPSTCARLHVAVVICMSGAATVGTPATTPVLLP